MAKYTSVVEVEAVQWRGSNMDQIAKELKVLCVANDNNKKQIFCRKDFESGALALNRGDWLVKHKNGRIEKKYHSAFAKMFLGNAGNA